MHLPVSAQRLLRVAVLVDLPRSAQSGGHVKWWERLAAAAAAADGAPPPVDLTVYFSGDRPDEVLSPHVRLRHLPPVFSTARLKFLPYVPDHTDLALHHPRLARELPDYDVIHATDGFFAFTRTAERVARRRAIPLTTSLHTDTPVYARIFMRQAIESWFARWPWARRKLLEDWRAPERQGRGMDRRLARHLRRCAFVFATRAQDRDLAMGIVGAARVGDLRLGVDRAMFGPHQCDPAGVRRDYAIPQERAIALFVGRVDVAKNAPTLIEAAARAIAAGAPLHLMIAGLGPLAETAVRRLGDHVSVLGFVEPAELARLFASVDFLAAPSEVEIGGLAIIEAIASGCPALVSPAIDAAGVFGPSPAIAAIAGGAEAWSAAFREMIADGDRGAAMRAAALDGAARRLASWDAVLREDLAPGWRAAAAARP